VFNCSALSETNSTTTAKTLKQIVFIARSSSQSSQDQSRVAEALKISLRPVPHIALSHCVVVAPPRRMLGALNVRQRLRREWKWKIPEVRLQMFKAHHRVYPRIPECLTHCYGIEPPAQIEVSHGKKFGKLRKGERKGLRRGHRDLAQLSSNDNSGTCP
jgi:hypothetical protein